MIRAGVFWKPAMKNVPSRLLSLLFVLSGCAAPGAFNVRGAAERIECPADQVTITDVGDSQTKLAEGCGRSEMYTNTGGWPAFWSPMPDLRKRASFDLSCGGAELTLNPLSTGRQQGVVGCGKKAVYSYVQTARHHYDWVLDSPVH